MDACAANRLNRALVADGALFTPDFPESAQYPELTAMLGRRAAADAELVVQARVCPNRFVEACGRIEGEVWVGKQAGAHRMWQDHFTRASALPGASTAVLAAPVGHAKALPLDTLIVTPTGPRALAEIAAGDRVLGGEGRLVTVTGLSPVWTDHELVELELEDDARQRCDLGHLWRARAHGCAPRTIAAERIVDTIDLGWSLPRVGGWRVGERRIVAWHPAPTVPVRCLAVDGSHTFVIAPDIVTHNSTQIHRWRVLWELGKNPNLRVLLLSATSQLPEKILSGIKADIEHNAFVQAVFPHLRPGRKRGQQSWSGTTIHLDRQDNLTDPSIECAGLSTKILGSRKDLIVIDDLLNVENTLTPYMRKQVWDRVQAEALSRRPPHLPSRAWFLGHPWTEDDAMAQACMQPGVRKLVTGARVQRGPEKLIITSADPAWNDALRWYPLLPELWSRASLEQRIESLGWAARFMIDCQFMRRDGMGFSPKLLALALMNGRGVPFLSHWNPLTTGCETYTGVDLSSGEGDDETVILTAARIRGQRRILEIQAGKWDITEIVARLHDVYARYKSTIAVESNGMQKLVRQAVHSDSMHITAVVDHHTGANKHALTFGIKHMEFELGAPGRWIFPRPANMLDPPSKEMLSLVHGAQNYSRDAKHTSDYVMAWWICWLAMAKDEGTALR